MIEYRDRDHAEDSDAEDAVALYDRLVDQIGLSAADMALSVLDGHRPPTLRHIALAQARRALPGLLARFPRASIRRLAQMLREFSGGEPISPTDVWRWKKAIHPDGNGTA